MDTRFIDNLLVVMALFIAGSICLSQIFQQPVAFSYALSDSMNPTIRSGDVFLLLPKLFFEPRIDDIIVFEMSGAYSVHRIVGETSQGFITRGDNSPFTDQQAGHPFVKDEMISGKVVSLFGKPLLIPKLGFALHYLSLIVKKNVLWVAIILGIMSIFSMKMNKTKRKIKKNRKTKLKFKHIYFASLLILGSITTFLMASKTGVWEIEYLTSYEAKKGDLYAVLPCGIVQREILSENKGYIPLYVIIQPKSSNTYVHQSCHLLWHGSTAKIPIQVNAREEIGWHKEAVQVCTYLPLLPPEILVTLSQIHPYVPIATITSMLTLIFGVIYKIVGEGNKRLSIRWTLHIKRRFRRASL